MCRNDRVNIHERKAAPWRAQQREPCHSVRRMRQCACQRQQVLHDWPTAQPFNFDRAKAQSGFLQPGYDFTEMATVAHQNCRRRGGIFAPRLRDNLHHFYRLGRVVIIEKRMYADRCAAKQVCALLWIAYKEPHQA